MDLIKPTSAVLADSGSDCQILFMFVEMTFFD